MEPYSSSVDNCAEQGCAAVRAEHGYIAELDVRRKQPGNDLLDLALKRQTMVPQFSGCSRHLELGDMRWGSSRFACILQMRMILASGLVDQLI
ncbi:hypothetical protein A5906_08355 [Bradyrhizobium sacchari]|nr:hypothetical protein A5906_08355 [Bradyrhizobium sacchari]